MDTSNINAQKVDHTTGILIGEAAPKQLIEFQNVRCPYCKKWFEQSFDELQEAVKAGKVQRVIKLFDKEKESLQRGNVMHRFITKNDGVKALEELSKIYETQNQWGALSLEEVAIFAKEQLGLTEQTDAAAMEHVIHEAQVASIQFVPTLLLDDHIFDESITTEMLASYLN